MITLKGTGTGLSWAKVHIWADSKAAIRRLQHSEPGQEQWLARRTIKKFRELKEQGTAVAIHWVP